jgi:two-component system, OmpR family, copper resistance phosphate regulon response regulator CusR
MTYKSVNGVPNAARKILLMTPRILIIEDEKKLATAVQEGLVADGLSAEIAHSGEDGFYLIHSQHFDLLILDIMLPGREGLEILREIRREGVSTPVLVLTSKDAVEDRVNGLNAGADDYLVKPFALAELQARVRALLRRGKVEASPCLRLADLQIDVASRCVSRAGLAIALTTREFSLLEYLFTNKCRVVSREMLARDVWKETSRYTPLDNVIDVQVARLRRKIDDNFEKKLLHTVRGVGFILREADA